MAHQPSVRHPRHRRVGPHHVPGEALDAGPDVRIQLGGVLKAGGGQQFAVAGLGRLDARVRGQEAVKRAWGQLGRPDDDRDRVRKVRRLEELCAARRQYDLQARIHGWLHNWLMLHLPLSVALIVLMFIHVWTAVKVW